MPMPPNTQMPVANQAAADRASTASAARMQANASAPSAGAAMMAGPAAAQKAAGAQAQEQGQIAAQAQTAEIQRSTINAQQELDNVELRNKERNMAHGEAMAKRHAEQSSRMNSYGRDVKQKLLEDAKTFDKRDRKAKFSQQRQLEDFLNTKTQDEQSMQNYKQAIEAAIQKESIVMRAAQAALMQEMNQNAQKTERELDRQSNERVKAALAIIQKRMDDNAKKRKKLQQQTGVLKMAAGGALMYGTGGAVGGTLAADGLADTTGADDKQRKAIVGAAGAASGGV